MSPDIFYVLDANDRPVATSDITAWARFMETNRIVARSTFGSLVVSTVFLGIDHGFGPRDHAPVLWETMIFPDAEYQERYASKADAIAGHTRAVDHVLAMLGADGGAR